MDIQNCKKYLKEFHRSGQKGSMEFKDGRHFNKVPMVLAIIAVIPEKRIKKLMSLTRGVD